jgi:hypothetical protein
MGTGQLETHLQTQIMNYLRLLQNRGYLYFYRIYNGPKIHTIGKKNIYTKNPCPGLPDLIIDPINHPEMWVELKTATGRLSEDQLKIQKQREKAGKIYLIWRSLEECICHMNSLGFKLGLV